MIRASKTKINPMANRQMNKTGLKRTIHTKYLDCNLDERGRAIKRGIDLALFTIDCEREADLNTSDAEARIVMCFVYEQLEKLEEE